ncbi:MAG: hypothetical protein VX820_00880 [Candidatus Neomarinimicrobiota bacterium]|nr:hypothetical protein [Candidatus Neomarinimicrobiota bacterium]
MELILMIRFFTILTIYFLLTSCGMVVSKLIPFTDLPKPIGKYNIGTKIETWIDYDRLEWFTENDKNDHRKIVVQFWYPTDDVSGDFAPYMDDWKKRIGPVSEQVEVKEFMISSIKNVNTNSHMDATIKKMNNKMPLIIFSHGLGGMRMQNTIQMETLASVGYFVLAIDHSYDANITLFDDGTHADFRSAAEGDLSVQEFWDLRIPQINTRSDDVLFVLDEIESFLGLNIPFWQDVDMGNIGVLGHSFGGATGIISSIKDDRIDACMALDGWIVPIESSYVQKGMNVPMLYIGRPKWDTPLNYMKLDSLIKNSDAPATKIILPDTKHIDYSDTPQFSPISKKIGISGDMPAADIRDTLNDKMLNFFDAYLRND